MENPKVNLETVKMLLNQANAYAKAGYSKRDNVGSKLNKILGNSMTDQETVELSMDNVPSDIINGITDNFNKIIGFIVFHLLNNDMSAFYGNLLIDTETDICYSQKGLIDTKFKDHKIILTYNPFYCANYTVNEIVTSTRNELEKITQMHPTVFASINREKDMEKHMNLEIGSSIATSEQLVKDMSMGDRTIKLHNDIYRRTDLEEDLIEAHSINRESSMEYYYKVAEGYRKKTPSGSHGGQGNGKGIATPNSENGEPIHQWEDISDTSEAEEMMRSKLKDAYDNLSDKQRGLMPSDLKERLEKLFAPPQLNWRDKLRRYVGSIACGYRSSAMRLNRRQPERTDLHGKLANKVVKLVIAIDTSGSMDAKSLEYCFNEIFDICKNFKTEYTVIECDAAIGKVYNPKKPTDIQLDVSGRGGTSFVPVIEYINEHKYFRDAVMIYFTDGYGDYEIPRPLTYRNIWVVMRDKRNLSLREPYGEVESLNDDDKYKNRR